MCHTPLPSPQEKITERVDKTRPPLMGVIWSRTRLVVAGMSIYSYGPGHGPGYHNVSDMDNSITINTLGYLNGPDILGVHRGARRGSSDSTPCLSMMAPAM